jgi:hypothetical protein
VSGLRPHLFLSICLLAGCANFPDSYPPPVQRNPLPNSEPSPVGRFVNMADPDAAAYIVADIADPAPSNPWRWTRKRPELQFFLESTTNLSFKADFSIAESTFHDTGPVVISVFINGHLLGTMKGDSDGQKHFEKPVPAALLRPHALNLAALEIDKVWVSKLDGAVLGFILTSAGFTP